MRLLNSVCAVIAGQFESVPIYIGNTPNQFARPSFLVTKVTNPRGSLNYNVKSIKPGFQIIYFGTLSEANQANAENLYSADDKLEKLFVDSLAMEIIPLLGEDKKRYAKITAFTSSIRLDEGAIYCNLTLDFTDDVPHTDNCETIGQIDMDINS